MNESAFNFAAPRGRSRESAFARVAGVGEAPKTEVREPVGVGREPVGVGDIASQLQTFIGVPNCSGAWLELFPTDQGGLLSTSLADIGPSGGGSYKIADLVPFLQSYVATASPTTLARIASNGGSIYFTFSTYNGKLLMRYHPSSGHVGVCTKVAPASGGGGVVPAPSSTPAASPPPGGPTWWRNSAWVYVLPVGAPGPTTPPPGITGPAGSVLGVWTETFPGRWVWFPPDGTIAQVNGVYVYGNASQLAAAVAAGQNPWTAVAPPSSPPVAGATGTWQQTFDGYFVFSGAAPLTTTDYSWLWWALGGVVVIGGVAYFIFD